MHKASLISHSVCGLGCADNLGSPCFSSSTGGCADTHVQSLVKGAPHCSLKIMCQWLPYV